MSERIHFLSVFLSRRPQNRENCQDGDPNLMLRPESLDFVVCVVLGVGEREGGSLWFRDFNSPLLYPRPCSFQVRSLSEKAELS